jgi:7-cyano-7-deazaguanine synthase in queuosine biosynthesis
MVLKEAGYDVEMVHFIYGQRSWLAELYSVYKLSKAIGVPLKIFDITDLYKSMEADKSSFLMNPNAKVYSGLKQLKKSVAAWVSGRNMLFATIAASYAESLMLNNDSIKKVYLASGWAQLSECIVAEDDQKILIECDINGTLSKPITEIKPGDKLFINGCESPNEITTTVKKVNEKVIDSYQYIRVKVYREYTYDKDNYYMETLKVGPNHRFYVGESKDNPNGWIKAKDLKPTMHFYNPFNPNDVYEVVENLTIRKPVRAIDLYCEPIHGFYLNGIYTLNSGSYPDNSERFNDALQHLFKFGLVKGHDIKILNVLSDIMKYEEWLLGEALGFPFEYTCSCDNPKIVWNEEVGDDIKSVSSYKELMFMVHSLDSLDNFIDHIELCIECGSTRNSRWAAKYANVKDPRRFYASKQHPEGYDPYEITIEPKFHNDQDKKKELASIIDRLHIDNKDKLKEKLL